MKALIVYFAFRTINHLCCSYYNSSEPLEELLSYTRQIIIWYAIYIAKIIYKSLILLWYEIYFAKVIYKSQI